MRLLFGLLSASFFALIVFGILMALVWLTAPTIFGLTIIFASTVAVVKLITVWSAAVVFVANFASFKFLRSLKAKHDGS